MGTDPQACSGRHQFLLTCRQHYTTWPSMMTAHPAALSTLWLLAWMQPASQCPSQASQPMSALTAQPCLAVPQLHPSTLTVLPDGTTCLPRLPAGQEQTCMMVIRPISSTVMWAWQCQALLSQLCTSKPVTGRSCSKLLARPAGQQRHHMQHLGLRLCLIIAA